MDKDRTKRLLADALLVLTNTKPLASISISDITTFCSMGRSAFYYHFKDKQELIYWIYKDFHKSKMHLTPDCIRKNLTELFSYMHKYSVFFKQAFEESGQNCFKDEYAHSTYKDCLLIIDSQDINIEPDLKDFVAKFFANAMVETSQMLLNMPLNEMGKYIDYLTLICMTNLSASTYTDELIADCTENNVVSIDNQESPIGSAS